MFSWMTTRKLSFDPNKNKYLLFNPNNVNLPVNIIYNNVNLPVNIIYNNVNLPVNIIYNNVNLPVNIIYNNVNLPVNIINLGPNTISPSDSAKKPWCNFSD